MLEAPMAMDETFPSRVGRASSLAAPGPPPGIKRKRHSAPAQMPHEDMAQPRRSISESVCPKQEESLVGMCAALAMRTPLALLLLEDPDSRVRMRALDGLRQLMQTSPELLSSYASAVAPLMQDPHWEVRKLTLETLAAVGPTNLVTHACTIATCICDAQWPVRMAAVQLLARLPPSTLVLYAGPVAQLLSDPAWSVRWHAVQALSVLDEAAANDSRPKEAGVAESHATFSKLVASARKSLCAELERRALLQAEQDGAQDQPAEMVEARAERNDSRDRDDSAVTVMSASPGVASATETSPPKLTNEEAEHALSELVGHFGTAEL